MSSTLILLGPSPEDWGFKPEDVHNYDAGLRVCSVDVQHTSFYPIGGLSHRRSDVAILDVPFVDDTILLLTVPLSDFPVAAISDLARSESVLY